MSKKGLFIVLDGPEGCGKTTQAKKLVQWLIKQNYSVQLTKEPGGTPEGKKIRQKLLDPKSQLTYLEELELFEQDRQIHIPVIQSWLNKGKIVVCDRFNASTFAYQVRGRKVISPKEFIDRNYQIVNHLYPDLSILLDIDPIIGFTRLAGKKPDRIEQAGNDFHQRVRQGFLEFVEGRPQDNWVVIDASQPINKIAEQIQYVVKLLLSHFNKK